MFIESKDIISEPAPMGCNEFFSHLPSENHNVPAKDIILIRATIQPNAGHGFHYHQDREEFLYILEGEIQQWVGQEKKTCRVGDVIHVPAGETHASFNLTDQPAKILAIFGNRSASAELATDVSSQEPWHSLTPENVTT